MKIAIIDYGAGNLQNVQNALQKLNINYFLATNATDLDLADKIILPGVGAAFPAMQKLQQLNLVTALKNTKKSLLGICLGMQLLTTFSEEGSANCLDILPQNTILFPDNLKCPQMGWNKIFFKKPSHLFDDIDDNSYFYFVHSYFVPIHEQYTLASTYYDLEFASAVQINNFYAVQFHPEKSGEQGLILLNNFCKQC